MEGKIQKSYKSSYPPGDAKEDWEIVNELASSIKRKKLYEKKEDLDNAMLNFLKTNPTNKKFQTPNYEFLDEKILLDNIDYYHSNVIARASKTMGECKSLRTNFKKTGTEG